MNMRLLCLETAQYTGAAETRKRRERGGAENLYCGREKAALQVRAFVLYSKKSRVRARATDPVAAAGRGYMRP
jgi:hypothetical protein